MLWSDVIDEFGEEMADKIIKSGYLEGVTCRYDNEMRVNFYRWDIEYAIELILNGEQK